MHIFNQIIRYIFWLGLVKPIVAVVIGLNIRNYQRLPTKGPCIIIANHNSHLDTLVLVSLFPLKLLTKIRPVAAADYFLKNWFMSWFSLNIIGIIPIVRGHGARNVDPFAEISSSLNKNEIIIMFPEGTRGEPEEMQAPKKGICRLVQKHPDAVVIPIFLHGLGKSLPRGESIMVPFFCDIFIGQPIEWSDAPSIYLARIDAAFAQLAAESNPPEWQ